MSTSARKARRTSSVLALFLALIGLIPPAGAHAGRLPSRGADETTATRQADLVRVKEVVAQDVVREALAAQGLTPAETEQRLAQLSSEDLRMLAAHSDQLQAAGAVPRYIWWLLAVLIAVTIIVTIA